MRIISWLHQTVPDSECSKKLPNSLFFSFYNLTTDFVIFDSLRTPGHTRLARSYYYYTDNTTNLMETGLSGSYRGGTSGTIFIGVFFFCHARFPIATDCFPGKLPVTKVMKARMDRDTLAFTAKEEYNTDLCLCRHKGYGPRFSYVPKISGRGTEGSYRHDWHGLRWA